jgi:hypothetical protein
LLSTEGNNVILAHSHLSPKRDNRSPMHIDLQLQLKHQDEFIRVEVDEQCKYIYVEWLKAPDTENFRESFQLAGTISLAHKCEYWLSDARQIPYLDFANQNWVLRAMKPLLMISSLKKFARLSSKESIGLMDVHRIYNTISETEGNNLFVQLESFSNKEAALDWLFSEYGKESSSNPYQ